MSSLWSGFQSLFSSLFRSLGFGERSVTLILLGLDNAGKTTLQHRLKTGNLQQFMPTQRAKEETLKVEGLTIKAWDLGGHQAARQLWSKYTSMADGIIFMMDANDPGRLAEAAQELRDLLDSVEMTDVPVAIFANKSEMKTALSLSALESGLRLSEISHPRLQLFTTSVIAATGYTEGFRWLAQQC